MIVTSLLRARGGNLTWRKRACLSARQQTAGAGAANYGVPPPGATGLYMMEYIGG
jgi:hypothetical protein